MLLTQQELARRLRWRSDYIAWCRERMNMPDIPGFDSPIWPKQDEVWQSVRDNRKTHVKSGHKTGKTLIAALIALWFLDCWRPSRVITTSASWPDVKMKLWGHIRDRYRLGGNWFGTPISTTDLKISDRHYATGLSCDRVEAAAGHNEKYVLVGVDEASSVSKEFMEAVEAEASRLLEIGNPLMAEGPFYQHARSREYHHITISCWDHPNVQTGKEAIRGGPSKEWCEDRLEVWGAGSPLYLTRVLGEFPEESEDTLFPINTIQGSFQLYRQLKDEPPVPNTEKVMGLDVARKGGDETCGYDQDKVEFDGRPIPRARKNLLLRRTDHHKTRMKVGGIYEKNPFDYLNIDAGGEGSGPADEIGHMVVGNNTRPIKVRRISFGGKAGSPDYFDVRAEMYWQLSVAMKNGMAIEPDEKLEEELIVIGGLADHKEKMVGHTKRLVRYLLPKDEIKERLGRSPDRADALALANYRRGGLGLLDLWKEEADKVRAQMAGRQSTDPKQLAATLAKAQVKALEDERFKGNGHTDEEPKEVSTAAGRTCPICGFGLAVYSESRQCNSCGWNSRNESIVEE